MLKRPALFRIYARSSIGRATVSTTGVTNLLQTRSDAIATEKWKDENREKLRQYRRAWYQRNTEQAKSSISRRIQTLSEYVERRKAEIGCKYCPEDHPGCLDFHHRDPSEKTLDVSRIVRDRGWSIGRIEIEIAKCDVVCANCHRKLHWTERRQSRQENHDIRA